MRASWRAASLSLRILLAHTAHLSQPLLLALPSGEEASSQSWGWGMMGTGHVLALTWVSFLCDLILKKL